MKLLDVITAAHGRVSGGDPHLWNCYGPNSYFMEFRDADGQGYSHCIYDTFTYEVYQIHAELPITFNLAGAPHQAFVWHNPKYKEAYIKECDQHGVVPDIAYDDVKYTEVLDEKIMLQYVSDIGATYYDNLPTPDTSLVTSAPGTFGGAKVVWPEPGSSV